MARRIPQLSTTLRRTLAAIGARPNTAPHRAVFAAVGALGDAEALPGLDDTRHASLRGGHMCAGVPGQNVWLLYRFDADHVFVITARAQPPVTTRRVSGIKSL
ncbi:MAG TPA: hypothetical protein VFU02_09260 [Polyangiaceae bacterium]|nr:hypothetical protein [Polyangiaceae bacterium]